MSQEQCCEHRRCISNRPVYMKIKLLKESQSISRTWSPGFSDVVIAKLLTEPVFGFLNNSAKMLQDFVEMFDHFRGDVAVCLSFYRGRRNHVSPTHCLLMANNILHGNITWSISSFDYIVFTCLFLTKTHWSVLPILNWLIQQSMVMICYVQLVWSSFLILEVNAYDV